MRASGKPLLRFRVVLETWATLPVAKSISDVCRRLAELSDGRSVFVSHR